MKQFLIRNFTFQAVSFWLLNTSIYAFVLRSFIPFLVYIFAISYLLFLIFNYKLIVVSKKELYSLLLYFGVSFLYIIGIVISEKVILYPIKEILNGGVILTFVYFINKLYENAWLINFKRLYFFFLLLLIIYIIISTLLSQFPKFDFNVLSIFLVIGLILIIKEISKPSISKLKLIGFNFLFLAISVILVISKSRRGLVVLAIVIVYTLFLQNGLSKLKYYYTLFAFFLLIILSFLIVSPNVRNALINKFDTAGGQTKFVIAKTAHKYISFFKHDEKFFELYNKLFVSSFNYYDPETWLNGADYLYNKKNEIIQLNSLNIQNWWNEGIYIQPLVIEEFNDNNYIQFSINCKVSNRFDFEYIRLRGSVNNQEKYYYYDERRKDEWQKLELVIPKSGHENKVLFFLEVRRKSLKKQLSAEEIFLLSSPQINKFINFSPLDFETRPTIWADFRWYTQKIINPLVSNDSIIAAKIDDRTHSFSNNSGAYTFQTIIEDSLRTNKTVEFKIDCFVDPLFNGNEIFLGIFDKEDWLVISKYDLSKKGTWQRLVVKKETKNSFVINVVVKVLDVTSISQMKGTVLLSNPVLKYNDILVSKLDPSKMQRSITSSVYAYSNKDDQLFSTRFVRWQYAYEIWQTKYNWCHKLFGHGFDYLEWFGEKFHNDPKRYDYPHNPIISAFLYSGIIGGLFYIYFLGMVFWYYWKYRKHHMVFLLMYLVTFFFMMFSGNSHFSVPIFTFLSLIPFLTKYYIESGKINTKQDAISTNSNHSNLQA